MLRTALFPWPMSFGNRLGIIFDITGSRINNFWDFIITSFILCFLFHLIHILLDKVINETLSLSMIIKGDGHHLRAGITPRSRSEKTHPVIFVSCDNHW